MKNKCFKREKNQFITRVSIDHNTFLFTDLTLILIVLIYAINEKLVRVYFNYGKRMEKKN